MGDRTRKGPTGRSSGGARPKASGGLPRVLFVRVSDDLLVALDSLVEQERRKQPWRALSRSDVAREILYDRVRERKG
jgi:hypothetical protein